MVYCLYTMFLCAFSTGCKLFVPRKHMLHRDELIGAYKSDLFGARQTKVEFRAFWVVAEHAFK